MFASITLVAFVLVLVGGIAALSLWSAGTGGIALVALACLLTLARIWRARHAAWKREWSPKPTKPVPGENDSRPSP